MLKNPESGGKLREWLATAVGNDCAEKILEGIGDPSRLVKIVWNARRALLRRRFLHHPLTSCFGFLRHVALLIQRFIWYPGMVVVLLGSRRDTVEAVAEGLEVALTEGLEFALAEFGVMHPRLTASSGRPQSIGETNDSVSAPRRLLRVL